VAPIAAQMSAEQVYKAYCMACHGEDGRGSLVRKAMPAVPDFTNTAWQSSRSASQLRASILNGKGQFMQPMKDKLGGTDVDQMVSYVRSFREGKLVVKVQPESAATPERAAPPVIAAPVASAPAGSESQSAETSARISAATNLYRSYCIICHGPDGKGGPMRTSMPSIPDFTDHLWQESHSEPQLAVSILNGKRSLMPAFQGRVNAEQSRDLVAYVRAFGPPLSVKHEEPTSDFGKQFEQLQEQWNELEKRLRETPQGK
jgi:cytochrome c oxidase cbb3-type subunit 3